MMFILITCFMRVRYFILSLSVLFAVFLSSANASTRDGQAMAVALEAFDGDGFRVMQVIGGAIDNQSSPTYGFYVLGSLVNGTSGISWNGQSFEAVTDDDSLTQYAMGTDGEAVTRPVGFLAQLDPSGQINWVRFIMAQAASDLDDSTYLVMDNTEVAYVNTEDWSINSLGDYFLTDQATAPTRLGGISVAETQGIALAFNVGAATRLYGTSGGQSAQYITDVDYDSGTIPTDDANFLEDAMALYIDDGEADSTIRSNSFVENTCNIGAVLDFDGNLIDVFYLRAQQDYENAPTPVTNEVPIWISDVFFHEETGNVYYCGFADVVGGAYQPYTRGLSDYADNAQSFADITYYYAIDITTYVNTVASEFNNISTDTGSRSDTVATNSSDGYIDWRTSGYVGQFSSTGDTDKNALKIWQNFFSDSDDNYTGSVSDDTKAIIESADSSGRVDIAFSPYRITYNKSVDSLFVGAGAPFGNLYGYQILYGDYNTFYDFANAPLGCQGLTDKPTGGGVTANATATLPGGCPSLFALFQVDSDLTVYSDVFLGTLDSSDTQLEDSSGNEYDNMCVAGQVVNPGTLSFGSTDDGGTGTSTTATINVPLTIWTMNSFYFTHNDDDTYAVGGGIVAKNTSSNGIPVYYDYVYEAVASGNSGDITATPWGADTYAQIPMLASYTYDSTATYVLTPDLATVVAPELSASRYISTYYSGATNWTSLFTNGDDSLIFWPVSIQLTEEGQENAESDNTYKPYRYEPLYIYNPDENVYIDKLDTFYSDGTTIIDDDNYDPELLDFVFGVLNLDNALDLAWVGGDRLIGDNLGQSSSGNLQMIAAVSDEDQILLVGSLPASSDDNFVTISSPSNENEDTTIENTSESINELYGAFLTLDTTEYTVASQVGYSLFFELPAFIDPDFLSVGDDTSLGIEPDPGTALIVDGTDLAIELPYQLYYDVDGNLTYKATDADDTGAQNLDDSDKRIRYTLDSYSVVGSSTTQTGNDIRFTLTEDTSVKVDYSAEYSTIWDISATDADDFAAEVLSGLPNPVPNDTFFWSNKDDTVTPYVTGAVSAPASTDNGIISGARYVVTEFGRDLYNVYSGLEVDDGNNEIILGDISQFATGDMTFQVLFEDVEWEEGNIYLIMIVDQPGAEMVLHAILDSGELTIYGGIRKSDGGHVNLSATLDSFESGMLTCVYSGMGTTEATFDVYLQEGDDSDVDQSGTDTGSDTSVTYIQATQGECLFSPSIVPLDSAFSVTASNYDIFGVPATISQIRWWDTALSEDDVETYGQKVLTGTESDLVGFWYFELDEGNTEEDLTGNGNTAVLADFPSNPYNFFVSDEAEDDSDYYLTPSAYSTSILSLPSYSQTGPVDLDVSMQKQWELVVSATEFEGTAAILPVVLIFDEEPDDLATTLQDDTLAPATNTDGTTGVGTYWINEGEYVVVGCFQRTGDGDGSHIVGWTNATNIADLTTDQKSSTLSDAVDDDLVNTLTYGVTVDAIESVDGDDVTVELTTDSQGTFYYFDTFQIDNEVDITWSFDNPVFYFTDDSSTTSTDASLYIGEKIYPFSTEDNDDIRNQVSYTETDGTTSTNYIIYELMDAYGIDETYWSSVEVDVVNSTNSEPALELVVAISSTSTAASIADWSAGEQAMVAMQPGTIEASWQVEMTYTDGDNTEQVVYGYLTIEIEVLDPTDDDYDSFYADQFLTMVLDAGNALLDPDDSDDYTYYDYVYWSGSDETSSAVLLSSTNGPELNAPYEGYTTLRFLTTDDGTAPRGDLNSEIWKILLVKTEALSYTDEQDGTISFTFADNDVDNVSVNVGSAVSSLDNSDEEQDEAGLGTGRLMSTSTYGSLAPTNTGIYNDSSDQGLFPGLPDGKIFPVNTLEYAGNGATGDDALPYQIVVVWFDGGDDYFGAYIPANPLQYTPAYPDYTECNGFITVSSTLGSQSLYGDGTYQEDDDATTPKYSTLPTSDFSNTSIYYQNDPDVAGYNPNEEHAVVTSPNSNTEQNEYWDEDGDAVFALRDDLSITSDNQGDYTNSPAYTSEPYVLVTYYDIEAEEYDMLIYKVYKDQAPTSATDSELVTVDFDLVGYEAGNKVEPPYPLSDVIGASSVPSFYEEDELAPNVPFWEDVNGDYWTVAGDSDFYGFFFYEMTGSFYFSELTDDDGTADYENGDVVSWYPTSLTEPIPSYTSGDDLRVDYDADPSAATWAPVEWTLDSEWPENVAILKIGETISYGGGDFYDDNSYYPTLPTIDYASETGTFILEDGDSQTSGSVSFQATADDLETSLNAMNSSMGPNEVSVSVTGELPLWVVTFSEKGSQTFDIASFSSDTGNYDIEIYTETEGDFDTEAVYFIYAVGVSESSDSAVWALETSQDDTDSTSSFSLRTTAPELELALNNMNSGDGPFGDGLVTVSGQNPTFTITWNEIGSRAYILEGDTSANIYPISFVEVTETVVGDAATAEVQTITLAAQEVQGLPGVIEWLSGQVVYDDLNPDQSDYESLTAAYEDSSVRFLDPFTAVTVDLEGSFSSSVTDSDEVFTTYAGSDYSDFEYFYMFSSSLQNRIAYDPSENQIAVVGLINGSSSSSGSISSLEADTNYLQPNILSGDDLEELLADVADDETWAEDSTSTGYMNDALQTLYYASRNPNAVFTAVVGNAPEAQTDDTEITDVDPYSWLVGLEDSDDDGYAEPASILGEGAVVTTNFAYLVNALADGTFDGAYIVIAENNDSSLSGETVDLEVVYIAADLVTGTVIEIDPNDAFQQKLTLRLDQDFGANASYYDSTSDAAIDLVTFDWIYQLPETGDSSYPQPPDDLDTDPGDWTVLNGQTGQEITIDEDTALLLTDYWWYARYKSTDETVESLWAGAANSETTSGEYVPQLSTGWVNRILYAINYFELRYTDLIYTDAPDPYTSIIQQAGAPYSGDVSLSDDQDYIQDVGLIEFYTTLYDYAYELADNAGVVSEVSDALLNASHRIAFLYYLLGNEAYADGLDSMLGAIPEVVDPDGGDSSAGNGGGDLQFDELPPTTHAFDEMLIGLEEEELALLRGNALSEPDDPTNDQPSTGAYPVHNRLYWNFTGGIGQTAYTLNYATTDYDFDGFIDEGDAEVLYPQGHGDAWGHYLSALDVYYELLSLGDFSWNYDSEPYEVDDSVIEVYYWNERRFAQAAAARVQCGVDILKRTFSNYYSEDSDGSWVGYIDTNEYRSWGVEGWARRTGQAAVFDWATSNALVPAAPAPESGSFTLSYDGLVTDDISIGQTELDDIGTIAGNIETALNDILGDGTVSVETGTDTDAVLLTFEITWATADDTNVLEADTSNIAPTGYAIVSEQTAGSADDSTPSVQILKLQQDERIFGTVSRTTVEDIGLLATNGFYIQEYLDRVNNGLNPLGLSPSVVPFGIDPESVLDVDTDTATYNSHFEQVYNQALYALRMAFKVYTVANLRKATLRTVERTSESLRLDIVQKDLEYKNELKKFFGSPYSGTMGTGKLYAADYDGPDYYLFNYLDNNVVNDYVTPLPSESIVDFVNNFPIDLKNTHGLNSSNSGSAESVLSSVFGHYFTSDGSTPLTIDFPSDDTDDLDGGTEIDRLQDALDMSFDGNEFNLPLTTSDYAYLAPSSWGQREYYGSIQIALTDMVQAEGDLRESVKRYSNLVAEIENAIVLIQAKYDVYDEILDLKVSIGSDITTMRNNAANLRASADFFDAYTEIINHEITDDGKLTTQIAGFSDDTGFIERIIAAVARTTGVVAPTLTVGTNNAAAGGLEADAINKEYHLDLEEYKDTYPYELQQQLAELQKLMNEEPLSRYEIFNRIEALRSAEQRYLAEQGEAYILWTERIYWNQKLAASIQERKSRDMAFRIERNHALEQYSQVFEMARRYAYLAAKAYDYETALDPGHPAYVGPILDEIMETHSLGLISGYGGGGSDVNLGAPLYGSGGLSHILAWLEANFNQISITHGHTQAGYESHSFSLRENLAGIEKDASDTDNQATDDYSWLQWLTSSSSGLNGTSTFYDDLNDYSYYGLYCRPWNTDEDEKVPGFVISFSSTVEPGEDFFGNDLDGGDSAYDPTRFATRIFGVAVEFENYDETNLALTPRCYLIPVGTDYSRVPFSITTELRSWNVVDQKLPIALSPTDAQLESALYSPLIDGVNGYFGESRLFSAFGAATTDVDDDLSFDATNTSFDTRLIGRSVWNSQWVLIIPLESMHYQDYDDDPTEGSAYNYFLPNVSGELIDGSTAATGGIDDIILHLMTYSYSGN